MRAFGPYFTAFVELEVTANGTRHSMGVRFLLPNNTVLHTDLLDPLSATQRNHVVERLVEKMANQPDEDAIIAEATIHLDRLASEVMDSEGDRPETKDEKSSLFQPIPPWPDPVDGLALHRELVRTFKHYLVLPNEEAAHALALWVLFSHGHESFEFSPLLVVTGATRGCGKTRVCDVIRYLSPRAESCVGVSDAALFRMIEARHPTVMVDEADNIDWRERKELAALLNAGFSKGAARIPRCVGDDHEVKDFSTWCPKVLAGRSARRILLDTTVSRSIVIDMRKRLKRETVERFRERKAAGALTPLCRQAARWAADNATKLADAEPTPFDQLEDRAEDAWTPLFAIADLLGVGSEARQAALVLSGGDAATDDDTNVELLRAVRQVFADKRDPKHLPTVEILAALRNTADSPWGAWNNGKGIRDRDLSKHLHDFGLAPKTVNVGLASNPKGYSLSPIIVALAPYEDFIRNSATSDGVKGLTGSFSSATRDESCGTKPGVKSLQDNESCGVAEEKGSGGAGAEEWPVAVCASEPGDAWEGDSAA